MRTVTAGLAPGPANGRAGIAVAATAGTATPIQTASAGADPTTGRMTAAGAEVGAARTMPTMAAGAVAARATMEPMTAADAVAARATMEPMTVVAAVVAKAIPGPTTGVTGTSRRTAIVTVAVEAAADRVAGRRRAEQWESRGVAAKGTR